MTNHTRPFTLTAIAAAMCTAFITAQAAENNEISALTNPDSTIQFGLGYVDSDNGRFGQYNGLNEKGAYGLLDADIVKRDDANGRWLKFRARNLGLDNRELRFEHEIQGNWGYYVDFSQTPRYEPYTVNTAVTGIGSNSLTIPTSPVTTGSAVQLKTKREAIGLGFNKYISDTLDFKVTFKNEEKDGARLWARGTSSTAGIPVTMLGRFEFMPEPINSTTRQLEAILSYTGDRLQLSGGYYGTMYNNQYNAIFITGGNPVFSGTNFINPVALPPDNHSHQLHLSGGYNFTNTARGTFKVAYARAKQEDSFLTAAQLTPATPVAAGLPANLGARVDTTLAQLGFSARPMPKLSVRANLRYEDRDDKTPLFRYGNPTAGNSTYDGFNEPRSIRTTSGKIEASYALPMALRLTGGIDYDEKHRNTSILRSVSFRNKTDETAYRVELRRSMSETITGAVAYIHSDRGGSPFLFNTTLNGGAGSNQLAPLHLADRKRETMRLTANWQPADPLSLQFRFDQSKDSYKGDRDGSGIGIKNGEAFNYTVDASYNFSERWQATAWYSHNATEIERESTTFSESRFLAKSVGLGLRGKPHGKVEVGADVSHGSYYDSYTQRLGSTDSSLPDVTTRTMRVQLFAKYELQKNSGLRLDYIFNRFSTNDWSWTNFTYLDGTTVTQAPVQKVNFLGVSYYYRWQ